MENVQNNTRMMLPESRLPRYWYNVMADMPTLPAPVLVKATGAPATAADFAKLYGAALSEQEQTGERYRDIPKELRALYARYRVSPLCRAERLEKALGTPARVYYKLEDAAPVGFETLATLYAQIWYHKQEGRRRVVTELTDGSWAAGAAYCATQLGMECVVYTDEATLARKPTAALKTRLYGGEIKVVVDPTVARRVADAKTACLRHGYRNFALLHQTIVGLEARLQLEAIDEYPDVVVGANDAGLNFASAAMAFMQDKLAGRCRTQFVLAETDACPIYTRGVFLYDNDDDGDFLTKAYTLGRSFDWSDGYRQTRGNPVLSQLVYDDVIEPCTVTHADAMRAGMLFARTEAILPSTASSVAVARAVREAELCRDAGADRVILLTVGASADPDFLDYRRVVEGEPVEADARQQIEIAKALAELPSPNAD